MEKFVAVIFETEEAAFAGENALKKLYANGDLAIYAAAIIGKDADGKVEVKTSADEGPIGTGFGLWIGALIGMLAGPVAVASGAAVAGSAALAQATLGGMIAGSSTGGLFGMFRDLWVSGVDTKFLDRVSVGLEPGKFALVASVDEVWTTPLDTTMEKVGGVVLRKARVEAVDEQWESEVRSLKCELDDLKAEMAETDAKNKANIQAKIDTVKSDIQDESARIKARLIEIDAEMKTKIDALNTQMKNASAERKQKIEKRKAEISADYKVRKGKLHAAAALAKEALT